MSRLYHRIVAALFVIAWVGWAAGAMAIEVTDDQGQQVRLMQAPKRIVSVLPSLTETVCALGACGRLVGVDRYSNHPASVDALPKVGGGIDPDVEAIVALRPDLVLLATSTRAASRLRALGLTVAAFEPRSHEDVRRVLFTLGRLLGQSDDAAAQRVWRDIEQSLIQAALAVAPERRGMRVYFEVNDGPYAAGPSSFIGETLTRLGLRNIVSPGLGPFPKLNPEFVVRSDPDLILVGDSRVADLQRRPGWSSMRAVRERQVCAFTPTQSDILVRAGPRLGEAASLLVACLGRYEAVK